MNNNKIEKIGKKQIIVSENQMNRFRTIQLELIERF